MHDRPLGRCPLATNTLSPPFCAFEYDPYVLRTAVALAKSREERAQGARPPNGGPDRDTVARLVSRPTRAPGARGERPPVAHRAPRTGTQDQEKNPLTGKANWP